MRKSALPMSIKRFSIIIFFVATKRLSLLCTMKKLLLLLILLGGMFTSCTSEYEERLAQGKELKNRLELVKGTSYYISNTQLASEIIEIKNEINLLAKVSGNEELFMKELFND